VPPQPRSSGLRWRPGARCRTRRRTGRSCRSMRHMPCRRGPVATRTPRRTGRSCRSMRHMPCRRGPVATRTPRRTSDPVRFRTRRSYRSTATLLPVTKRVAGSRGRPKRARVGRRPGPATWSDSHAGNVGTDVRVGNGVDPAHEGHPRPLFPVGENLAGLAGPDQAQAPPGGNLAAAGAVRGKRCSGGNLARRWPLAVVVEIGHPDAVRPR
jgi:hypothetical protein